MILPNITAAYLASKLLSAGSSHVERLAGLYEMYPYAIFRDFGMDKDALAIYDWLINDREIGELVYKVACYESCPPINVEPNPCVKKFTVNGQEEMFVAMPDTSLCSISRYYETCRDNSYFGASSDGRSYSTFGSMESFGEEIVPIVGRLKNTAYGLMLQYARNNGITFEGMEQYVEYYMRHIDFILREAARYDEKLVEHVVSKVCDSRCMITSLPGGGYGTVPECDYVASGYVIPVTYSAEVCSIATAMQKCVNGPEKNETLTMVMAISVCVILLVLLIVAISCCIKCYLKKKLIADMEKEMSNIEP